MSNIQSKTDSIASSEPRGIDEVTKESQQGLNAVQSDADKDKMIAPKDAKEATTFKEKTTNILKEIVN